MAVLQIVDDPEPEVLVPEMDVSFGDIIRAQAHGDFEALRERKRRAIRVSLGKDISGGLERLESLIRRSGGL